MRVIGIDGCKAGWICVAIEDDQAEHWVARRFEDVLLREPAADLILVDIPIGLLEGGTEHRAPDAAARRLLGGKRASSVFTSPVRPSIYRLRTEAGGLELIETLGNELRLRGSVRFDFQEGEQAAATGDPERAFALLEGDFLAGFSVPESAEWETWVDSQRSRFEELWVRAGVELARRKLGAGLAEEARRIAEALWAADLRRNSLFPSRLTAV